VGLCFPCLGWWGRLCRRRCAAGGCAHAILMWGGVSRGYTTIIIMCACHSTVRLLPVSFLTERRILSRQLLALVVVVVVITRRVLGFNTQGAGMCFSLLMVNPRVNPIWPLQDIVFLRGCCARIHHLFIPPAHLHCSPWCNTSARSLGSIRPPLRTLVCMLCTIQYW